MSAPYRSAYAVRDTPSTLESLLASPKGAWVAAGIAISYLIYNFFPPSTLGEYLWHTLVLFTPAKLVFAIDRKRNPDIYEGTVQSQSSDNTYAMKSEALGRMLGLESGPAAVIPGVSSLRRASWLGGKTARSDAPPGLGNWDNSCYQNSVLQGLSALRPLLAHLDQPEFAQAQDTATTAGALRELMAKLNDSSNNGRRIWTPAKLKSMSSWQQQDAQEYFSKVMDDMEKDAAKSFKATPSTAGLQEIRSLDTVRASAVSHAKATENERTISSTSPLDGYLAQRVACTSCGFSEGLSMIPFNCLTVPLGKERSYQIEDCLAEYAGLEEISGVECAKCTLLRTQTQLQNMTAESSTESENTTMSLPSELRVMALKRLQAVEQALRDGDVSDDTLNNKCQIPKKSRVTSTKTRQAVIARAPPCLVIHINRSVFDEYTGDQRKNMAQVTYPKVLNLGPWCLGSTQNVNEEEEWRMGPTKSMITSSRDGTSTPRSHYVLRAAVTHYGQHENGHYICYRGHPEQLQPSESGDSPVKPQASNWWRLSDDDVSEVTEEHVLGQGGVFMLFYEYVDEPMPRAAQATVQDVVNLHQIPSDTSNGIAVDSQAAQEEVPAEVEKVLPEMVADPAPTMSSDTAKALPDLETRRIPTPQTMRTAGKRSKRGKGGLSSTFRAVAAT